MKTPLFLSLVGATLLIGCGDNSSKTTAPTTNSTSGSAMSAPADYLNGLAGAQSKAIKTVDVASLNQALQMYNVQEGHYPADLNELVQSKLINKIPDAPNGMKLSYDASTGKVSVVPE